MLRTRVIHFSTLLGRTLCVGGPNNLLLSMSSIKREPILTKAVIVLLIFLYNVLSLGHYSATLALWCWWWRSDESLLMSPAEPCMVDSAMMTPQNIAFRYLVKDRLYVPHNDYVEFRCTRGSPFGSSSMRRKCVDSVMTLPTCYWSISLLCGMQMRTVASSDADEWGSWTRRLCWWGKNEAFRTACRLLIYQVLFDTFYTSCFPRQQRLYI